MLPKFNKNEEREKEKGGERKQRNFGNTVTEIPLPKMLSVQLKKEQLQQCHCWKRKTKNFVLVIVAMRLPKMEKKNYEICEWVKKKLSRTQYFYNIFIINHTWLIIISSKNLWQINCGNGIAENVKKKLWNLWMSKKKVVTYIIFLQYFHNKSHVINYY